MKSIIDHRNRRRSAIANRLSAIIATSLLSTSYNDIINQLRLVNLFNMCPPPHFGFPATTVTGIQVLKICTYAAFSATKDQQNLQTDRTIKINTHVTLNYSVIFKYQQDVFEKHGCPRRQQSPTRAVLLVRDKYPYNNKVQILP